MEKLQFGRDPIVIVVVVVIVVNVSVSLLLHSLSKKMMRTRPTIRNVHK